jgi:hypothetical protein
MKNISSTSTAMANNISDKIDSSFLATLNKLSRFIGNDNNWDVYCGFSFIDVKIGEAKYFPTKLMDVELINCHDGVTFNMENGTVFFAKYEDIKWVLSPFQTRGKYLESMKDVLIYDIILNDGTTYSIRILKNELPQGRAIEVS